MFRAIVLGMLLPAIAFAQDVRQVAHTRIAAVCPIVGVSFGKLADTSTWVIAYDKTATARQKSAAQSVVTTFVFTSESALANRRARLDEILTLRARIAALNVEMSDPQSPFILDCQPLIDAATKRISEIRSAP